MRAKELVGDGAAGAFSREDGNDLFAGMCDELSASLLSSLATGLQRMESTFTTGVGAKT